MTPQMADTPQDALTLAEVHSLTSERHYEHLEVEDHLLILRLAEKDTPQTEIAKRLGCSQATVSRSLKKHRLDTSQLAVGRAKASVYKAVERAIDIAEKGEDEDTALKAIKLVGGIAGVIQSNQQVTVNNTALFAQPDKPETWGPGPQFAIEAEAKVGE